MLCRCVTLGNSVEERMRTMKAFMRIMAVTLVALAMSASEVRAAVTAYADEIPSGGVVAASAPAVETNGGNSQVRIDETGVHIGGQNPVDINTPAYWDHGSRLAMMHLDYAVLGSFALPVFII